MVQENPSLKICTMGMYTAPHYVHIFQHQPSPIPRAFCGKQLHISLDACLQEGGFSISGRRALCQVKFLPHICRATPQPRTRSYGGSGTYKGSIIERRHRSATGKPYPSIIPPPLRDESCSSHPDVMYKPKHAPADISSTRETLPLESLSDLEPYIANTLSDLRAEHCQYPHESTAVEIVKPSLLQNKNHCSRGKITASCSVLFRVCFCTAQYNKPSNEWETRMLIPA
jgi:hypothetical protein